MTRSDDILLTSEFSELTLRVDSRTGAPLGLALADGSELDFDADLAVTLDGVERRGPMGGLVYEGSTRTVISPLENATVRTSLGEGHRVHSVVTAAHDQAFVLEWTYRFQSAFPRIAATVEVRAVEKAVVRNIELDLHVAVASPDPWRFQAPGGKFRADLELTDVTQRLFVSPVGGVSGSTGLIALENVETPLTWVFWPMQTATIGDTWIEAEAAGLHVHWLADVAGMLDPGDALIIDSLLLDLVPASFDAVLSEVPRALETNHIAGRGDGPAWADSANLYEVQIGFSVFQDGYEYSPYPTVRHLIDDLDRVHALGYTALQMMPRHPFPSYNVADYADITKSYGDEDDLRELIQLCHERGMHVILDILLHGVIDKEIVETAVASINAGPYASRMGEFIDDITVLEEDEDEPYSIAWARHVLDFGPHWSDGSPQVHPLRAEHPEWFCEDSSGNPIGIYTNAFDTAHPGWQAYFISVCLDLLARTDADGFRFDAPSYNYFMNWSERTRGSAHVSMLGSIPLFAALREQIRAVAPDALLYTEPSGALFRRDMDLTYNYDEQWLVRAITTSGTGRPHWVRSGRELVEWLAHRDRGLPRHAATAHHIDSHDTFWWPSPGRKWRREQHGEARTAALMAIFALRGEPYMTFVGGEVGIEAEVRSVNHARLEHPVLASGEVIHGALEVSDDRAYAILLRGSQEEAIVLVNTVDQPITVDIATADGETFEEVPLEAARWQEQGAVNLSARGVATTIAGAGVRVFVRAL